MISFIQSFGVEDAGGGSRILRALLPGIKEPVVSISTHPVRPKPTNLIREIHIPGRPYFGRIEHTRLNNFFAESAMLFEKSFCDSLMRKLVELKTTRVHGVPHDLSAWSPYIAAKKLGIPYHLSVHDHIFEVQSTRLDLALQRLCEMWNNAESVAVISDCLAEDYCSRFGKRSYVCITDGWSTLSAHPRQSLPNSNRIYFMGLMHWDYRFNFANLNEALDILQREDPTFAPSVTIRGSLDKRFVQYTRRSKMLPWGLDEDVQRDMLDVDYLYLPMPFTKEKEWFARYSLSTKLVTYLASGLPIIYHGPEYAEAHRLLKEHDAAILLTSSEPAEIARSLSFQLPRKDIVTVNAIRLAERQFKLEDQQAKFAKFLSDAKTQVQ